MMNKTILVTNFYSYEFRKPIILAHIFARKPYLFHIYILC